MNLDTMEENTSRYRSLFEKEVSYDFAGRRAYREKQDYYLINVVPITASGIQDQ